jgi:ferritin-like protein
MSVIVRHDIELAKEDLRMARAAREMEEPAGVSVDQAPEWPVSNAATDLTTHYYYTIVRTIVN